MKLIKISITIALIFILASTLFTAGAGAAYKKGPVTPS